MATVNRGSSLGFMGRIAVVTLFLAGIVLSGKFADLWDGSALIFVIGGTTALTLLGFSFSQIGAAARCITGRAQLEEDVFFLSHFWEALGRNFWIIGVLGSLISFVLNLVQGQGGIQDMAFRLASSFRPAVFGLVLGILCGLPALKRGLDASPFKHP
jgi:hypothetical protein